MDPDVMRAMPMIEYFAPTAVLALARFGRWNELLTEPLPADEFAFAAGMAHYTRGLALSARGQPDEATAEQTRVAAAAAAVPADRIVGDNQPAAAHLRLAATILAGEIAARRGDPATAIATLEEAVRMEDALPYTEPPAWYQPVRHLLGAELLAAGRPVEAEAVYRDDLASASPARASDGRALKFRPAPADNGPAGVLRGPPERPNMRVVPPRPPTLPALLLSGLLLAPLPVAAQTDDSHDADHRGWSYLVDKLVADGLDRSRVTLVFDDPRLPPFDGLEFSAAPRESHTLYRGFQRPASIAAARGCRAAHAEVLEAAERGSGVPADVVAAILYVETGCGRNTGSSMILHRLARLAMANEPANLRDNLERQGGAGECDTYLEERLRARARYLEDTFYPEVRAAFDVADRLGVPPLSLRGSASGAIGTPQFLPTNYLRFGTDGDHDGRVDLFDPGDAAASCARYLSANGWRPGLAEKERRAVIWRYNHSDAYIDAVLALARRIGDSNTPAAPTRKAPRSTRRPAKRGGHARS